MARILINAIGAEMGGAIRHLTSFLPALGEADTSREYVVLVRQSTPDIKTAANILLERHPNADARSQFWRLGSDQIQLPLRLRREKFAGLVSLLNFGPIRSPAPHILFQRNSLYYCPHYLESSRGIQKVKTQLLRRLAMASMQGADCVVTPSDAMAAMIRASCPGLHAKEFAVLPHGFQTSALAAPLEQQYTDMLQRCEGVRLLYPTHPAPHKGFPILFKALALLRQKGIKATLFTTIDHADWPVEVDTYNRQISELRLEGAVVFMGRVPQAQMGAIYLACDLMINPSLCESFGFSFIEAMGHRLPVVASATDLNREMCQDAALYYSPCDAEDACAQIERALVPATLKQLIENGQGRLNGFDWSWQRYARDFTKLIGRVC